MIFHSNHKDVARRGLMRRQQDARHRGAEQRGIAPELSGLRIGESKRAVCAI